MELKSRIIYTFVEHKIEEAGRSAEIPLRKVSVAAVLKNPYAGKYVEDLRPMIEASAALGAELSKIAIEALAPYKAQSYGKAGNLVLVQGNFTRVGGKSFAYEMRMYETDSMTHCATQKTVEVCFDTQKRASADFPDDIRAKLLAMAGSR